MLPGVERQRNEGGREAAGAGKERQGSEVSRKELCFQDCREARCCQKESYKGSETSRKAGHC